MFRGIRAKLSGFMADTKGVVIYLFALLMVPLIVLTGVAVDMGQLLSVKNQLRGAIDAAALSIATTPAISQADALTQAQNFVNANFSAQYPTATLSSLSVTLAQDLSSGSCPANTVCITASATVNTSFLKVFWPQYNTLSTAVTTQVRAAAQSSYCMLTLDPAGWSQWGGTAAGLELVGGPTLTMNGCGIAVNATGSQALMVDAGASLNSPLASVVGQLDAPWANGRVQITNLKQNQQAVADPYRDVQMPAATSNTCSASPYTYSSGSSSDCDCTNFTTTSTPTPDEPVTLNPGRYCQGLSINNGFKAVLNSGVYYIKSGQFNIAGGASVSGTGVTFVLTTGDGGNTYATLSITNGTDLILSAPTSGQAAGILFFGDRNAPSTNINYITGFHTLNWTGVIYLPSQMLSYSSGGPTTALISGCQQAIAWDIKDALYTLTFDGTCTNTGMRTIGASSAILVK